MAKIAAQFQLDVEDRLASILPASADADAGDDCLRGQEIFQPKCSEIVSIAPATDVFVSSELHLTSHTSVTAHTDQSPLQFETGCGKSSVLKGTASSRATDSFYEGFSP